MSQAVEVGGSLSTGGVSSTCCNDAYVGMDKSAFNLITVEGWLTDYAKPHLYIAPHFQFSTIKDRALRAELAQPTLFFVRLVTGVEF